MAFDLNKDKVPKRSKAFDLDKPAPAGSPASSEASSQSESSPLTEQPVNRSYWLPLVLLVIAVAAIGWWLLKSGETASQAAGSPPDAGSESGTITAATDAGNVLEPGQPGTDQGVASGTDVTSPTDATATTAAVDTAVPESASSSDVPSAAPSPVVTAGASDAKETSPSPGTSADPRALKGEPVAAFAAGSSVPSADDRRLKEIVAFLTQSLNATVVVDGYASSEGDPSFNQRLSQKRADRYKRLIEDAGIAGGRVTAQGRGISNPVASNDTEDGRRKNRRVEVTVQ